MCLTIPNLSSGLRFSFKVRKWHLNASSKKWLRADTCLELLFFSRSLGKIKQRFRTGNLESGEGTCGARLDMGLESIRYSHLPIIWASHSSVGAQSQVLGALKERRLTDRISASRREPEQRADAKAVRKGWEAWGGFWSFFASSLYVFLQVCAPDCRKHCHPSNKPHCHSAKGTVVFSVQIRQQDL